MPLPSFNTLNCPFCWEQPSQLVLLGNVPQGTILFWAPMKEGKEKWADMLCRGRDPWKWATTFLPKRWRHWPECPCSCLCSETCLQEEPSLPVLGFLESEAPQCGGKSAAYPLPYSSSKCSFVDCVITNYSKHHTIIIARKPGFQS